MNKNAKGIYEDLKANRLEEFTMRDVYPYGQSSECGTPMCILGHALYRMGKLPEFIMMDFEQMKKPFGDQIGRRLYPATAKAYKWLGLTKKEGEKLCFNWSTLDAIGNNQTLAAKYLKAATERSAKERTERRKKNVH